jgi:capsule polysaccharide export protein KpsE/RkpR
MADSHSTTSELETWTQPAEAETLESEEQVEPMSEKAARFVRSCWVRRKLFVGVIACGILLTLAYALSLHNLYTSTTTLMPPENSSPYSSIMGMLSGSGSASIGSAELGLNTPGELFISVLGSRNVQDGLIKRFDLIHYYKARIPDDARRALAGGTKIDADRKSGVITISVTAPDPVFASKLANGYVEELNRVLSDDSTSSARRQRVFLEERLKAIKQDLDNSSKALSQFSSKNKAIDISSQAKTTMETGLRLQAELIDGRSQLAALRQTYSEDNNRVKAIEARNAELQRQIDAMGGSPKRSATSPGDRSSYPTVGELPSLGVTYYDLDRQVRVDEALWEALMKQYEAAKVEEARQTPTVRVLDAAEIPPRKSWPIRRNIAAVGAFVSLFFACLLVFVLDYWEQMDSESEPKKMLTEIGSTLLDHRRWYWHLPGLNRLQRRMSHENAKAGV